MATEPRYTYDPVTQTFTRVDTPVAEGLYSLAPNGLSNGFEGSTVSNPSPMGSAGAIGDLALGLGAYSELGPLAPGSMVAGFGSNVLGNVALDQQAQIDADIAAANRAGTPVATTSSFLSGNAVTTNPQTISGLQGLAAMNAAQNAQSVQNAQAAQQAAAVADIADIADAEAGAAMDAGVSGAANEASHGADGNDPGSSGSDGSTSTDTGGFSEDDSTNAGESDNDTYFKGGRVMKYAQGGIADAYKTQAKGRGNDTMLVHMTPGEVQGLQALAMKHGGSLTINPQTGLPEAGFLSSILPMIAGAALASTGIGAPLAAGLVGVGSYAMNPKKGLMGGIMAGLSAYGGANLATGLVGATSIGAEQAAAQGGYDELIKQGFVDQGGNLTQAGMQLNNPAMEAAVSGGMEVGKQGFSNLPIYDQLGQSAQQIAAQPVSSTMSSFGGPMGVASIAAPVMGAMAEAPEATDAKKPESKIRPFKFSYGNQAEENPDFKYRTGAKGESTAEQRYFTPTYTPLGVFKPGEEPVYGTYAKGGGVGIGALKARKVSRIPSQGYKFNNPKSSTMEDTANENFAKGGQPRFLSGGGDGMSDDIPATIEDKQPARLADGEFVVPADVVSHLGNGSSKAGAKKLYAMMDRIRHARTGKKSQAPEVNAKKYMPA